MRFTLSTVTLVALALSANAAPTSSIQIKKAAEANKGSYIVKLKDNASKSAFFNANKDIKNSATHADWSADLFNGFAFGSRDGFRQRDHCIPSCLTLGERKARIEP